MSSAPSDIEINPLDFWTDGEGTYLLTFEQMKSVFASYEPVYTGSLILFPNDTALGNAVKDIESGSDRINPHVALTDLDVKIYLGVQGGDGELFTYNLIRVCSGTEDDIMGYFVLTHVGNISEATYTALNGYGNVYVRHVA